MNKLIKGLLAIGVLVVSTQAFAGPVYGGHTYFLTSSAGSWTAAEAEAITFGGNLVAINDAAEQAYLLSEFGGGRLWIGYNDAASEGSFVWSNGDPTTYTNWAGSEPNNCCAGEDYTVMNWAAGGAWNDCPDAACHVGGYFGIIELASVPEPASIALVTLGLLGLRAGRRATSSS